MRRVALVLITLSLTALTAAHAQSSQFGVRGLGLPGRASSAHSLGLGGAFGMFDGESSLNPAALGSLMQTTSIFTSSASWRTSWNPAGTAATADARFPQILVGGPIPSTRLGIGVSYSTYADRDFTLVSSGIASPRGVPINYTDTLSSLGGINDLRLAVSYVAGPHLLIGAGLHFLTGSNRLQSRRAWEDSSYLPIAERSELSYQGIGFSAGLLFHPVDGLAIAATVRRDGTLDIQRDSSATSSGKIKLPLTLAGAVRFRVHRGIELTGAVTERNWSTADAGLRAVGGVGADNTLELNGGVEILRNLRRPAQKPVRLGVRYTKLPFLIAPGVQPTEWGLSAGTGVRFAGDRGGVDFALERFQRSQGSEYRERGWTLSVGVSVRAGGFRP
ncbi:MAG: hypothetical protein ABJC19_01295 [Gemmatimonadota bacterium]